jgi:hypothetical protein
MPSETAVENFFVDADAEWSDEEQLIPKNRRKTQYVPPAEPEPAPQGAAERESWAQSSSSDSNSPKEIEKSGLLGVGSPLIPPKSPSRPDVRPGSSHDDLVQRFYQVTRERDALRKELQRRSMGPNGIPARASVVYRSDEKTLIEGLHELRYAIRAWSEEYFSGAPPKRSKRPHIHTAKELFGNLTENPSAYIKHYTDRPLLIQAYLWSKLQERIFSNFLKGCGYVWAGKLGDRKLRPINDTLRKGRPILLQPPICAND